MKRYTIVILFGILFLASSGRVWLFAQESATENAPIGAESQNAPMTTESRPAATATEPQPNPIATESEVQWLWGEVVSVDANAKQMVVKYLDYETDTEKEININVDDKTIYENVKALDEIKAQDTLSVDYIVIDTKNIAKNISVEKNEETPTPTGTEETKEEPKPTPGLE